MKTAGSELVYGLKDGKLIYIDEAENGLDCGCVCPSCGKPLIARQGQKNAALVWLLHLKKEKYGFKDRDFSL